MKWLRRSLLTLCYLGLVAIAPAWIRTRSQQDIFAWSNRSGRVVGLATAPGEWFYFKHIDTKADPRRLAYPDGFRHLTHPMPPSPGENPYLVRTHIPLMASTGVSASNGLPVPTSRAQVSRQWSIPSVTVQGGSFRNVTYRQVIVSFWLIACLFAVLPAVSMWRWAARLNRRTRHLRHGQCLNCGYDVRASTTRCPECNHPIPTA